MAWAKIDKCIRNQSRNKTWGAQGKLEGREGEGRRQRLPGNPEALKERHDWKDLRMNKLEYLKLCKTSKEATCPCGRDEWGSLCSGALLYFYLCVWFPIFHS